MYIEYLLELLYPLFLDFLNPLSIYSLTLINKDLSDLFKKKGYLKEISYHHKKKYKDFISLFIKHKDYINTVTITEVTDPFIWSPIITMKFILHNCYLAHSFARYDNLKILYLDRCCLGINLNWGNLRNLEVLYAEYIINSEKWCGIEACSNLSVFYLNNPNSDLNLDNFNKLKNLEYLITNSFIKSDQNLITPKLKYFIGVTKSIQIDSPEIIDINLGHKINNNIIDVKSLQLNLYEISKDFLQYNLNYSNQYYYTTIQRGY